MPHIFIMTFLNNIDKIRALFARNARDKKEEDRSQSTVEECRLLCGQFSISSLKLEIHSCGRPLAELQVTNVKAGVTKRPFDTTVQVSVHSLLIVDALQTYGPDFELLVASHKHITYVNTCVSTN
jgi:vacuolar protein sorting-associated protein 13D